MQVPAPLGGSIRQPASDLGHTRAMPSTSPRRERGARKDFVSSRGALLLLVGITAVVLLALPLRELVRQVGEINGADQQRAETQARVDDLQARIDRWEDPSYLQQQARERLRYVLPGEVMYQVVGDRPAESQLRQQAPQLEAPSGSWYERLWSSVQAADRPTSNGSTTVISRSDDD